MKQDALQRIIERVGSQKKVAEELGVYQQTISWWLKNGNVPAKRVQKLLEIDRKYGGKTKPSQLNPVFELRA